MKGVNDKIILENPKIFEGHPIVILEGKKFCVTQCKPPDMDKWAILTKQTVKQRVHLVEIPEVLYHLEHIIIDQGQEFCGEKSTWVRIVHHYTNKIQLCPGSETCKDHVKATDTLITQNAELNAQKKEQAHTIAQLKQEKRELAAKIALLQEGRQRIIKIVNRFTNPTSLEEQ